jgi:hypothetical protein
MFEYPIYTYQTNFHKFIEIKSNFVDNSLESPTGYSTEVVLSS